MTGSDADSKDRSVRESESTHGVIRGPVLISKHRPLVGRDSRLVYVLTVELTGLRHG
jgi:hypothetical protein